MTRLGSALLSIPLAIATLPAWAQVGPGPDGPNPHRPGMMWGYNNPMWGGGGPGWHHGGLMGPLMMLLALVGIVAIFLWAYRAWGHNFHRWHRHAACPHCGHGGGQTALDILAERFARGEIDTAEFDARRKAIRG